MLTKVAVEKEMSTYDSLHTGVQVFAHHNAVQDCHGVGCGNGY